MISVFENDSSMVLAMRNIFARAMPDQQAYFFSAADSSMINFLGRYDETSIAVNRSSVMRPESLPRQTDFSAVTDITSLVARQRENLKAGRFSRLETSRKRHCHPATAGKTLEKGADNAENNV